MALTLINFVSGTPILAAEVNKNFNDINTSLFAIKNGHIANDAAIADLKLATISTADKVDGAAVIAQTIDAVKGQFAWYLPGEQAVGANLSAEWFATAVLTAVAVFLHVKTAPTDASLIVDINKNGTSIFSTQPEIAAGATTGGDSAAFDGTITFADNDSLRVDVDQIGSTLPGENLTIVLKCEQKVPQ